MIIIDVGAHDGTKLSVPMAQDRNNLVYAIEPIPELAEKIRSYQLPNINVFCTAMGAYETTSKFHVNRDNQTSSLLRANCQGNWQPYVQNLEEVKSIEVPVTTLESFINKNGIAEIDLLKIDTQGFDFQVLKGAGKCIHSIKRILLEVQTTPLYEGSAGKDEVVDYLTKVGFRLVRSISQTGGLEENLEFVRVNRYPLINNLEYLDVLVPYVGIISTTKNDYVGQLLEQGVFESPELAFLWLYLRPGDTFFDCGSHVGIFSCVAAKKMKNNGRIISFEPNKISYEIYKSNLERLECECFTALNIGLSDKGGTAELLLGKSGNSAFSTFATEAKLHTQIGDGKVVVELSRLDDIIEELNIDKVTLAKLDVEGWEYFVLNGANQAIEAGKLPVWMIEFTEANAIAAGTSTKELRQLIESFGYHLCRFDATNFRLVPESHKLEYLYDNLFAVANIDDVNTRLSSAEPEFLELAKDLVSRWDIAIKARQFDYIEPQVGVCEADRADRLTVINKLSPQLQESEADRAARLTVINQLSQKIEESEADRAARLTVINQLSQKLEESEADRAARLGVINQLSQKLEESEADRAARLTMINQLTQKLDDTEAVYTKYNHQIEKLSNQNHQFLEILQILQSQSVANLQVVERLSEQNQQLLEHLQNKQSANSLVKQSIHRLLVFIKKLLNLTIQETPNS
ncbi:hypothetical protein DSM106972_018600 [Dulcicalothrix desertica PCC 7102]|uniref:Methyltransferase FkbM domain-containing protein n=1 Tax=Dulcicalothrix desertica PCC 7102 TaxID=232991 RepID=A0A433VND2_9CYAN|nr:FkbM family methyltransferase [Dulcicalothrix desertica]RUT07600.1 hypothetical protein DSM106972_018600 [Dulcicalothrix desertica PCC 7102]